MGKAQRTKGHNFEREIRNKLLEIFPNCQTSRYANRSKDDECVDLCFTDPFNIQCKAWASAPNLHKELKKMPNDKNYNVIFHKRPNQGTVIAMTLEDFIEVMAILKKEEVI